MPVVVGVFFVASIYGRVNAANDETATYEDYLNSARKYREERIFATSKEEYEKALEMNDSFELRCEIEEMLEEEGNASKIENWCEKLIEKYPNEPKGYEDLISHYKEIEKYDHCFEQYEIVKKRNIVSEPIEEIIATIKFEYTIQDCGYDEISDFVSGYAVYKDDDLYGLIAKDGEVTLRNFYNDMFASDGTYAAITDDKNESYFIDFEGDRRFNFPKDVEIEKLGMMYEDIIPVYTKGKVYYYTASDGLQILGPYDDGESFYCGVAAVKEGDDWFLITPDGTKVTEAYDGFYMNSSGGVVSNGRIFALKGDGYVMLDENLQLVSDAVYEDVKEFSDSSYAAVKKDGKWGFIDNSGNFVIKPEYEDAYSFSNGLAPVYSNGLWGFIDTNNRWAVEPLFIDARPLSPNGCGFVKQQDETDWDLIKFVEFNY